MVIANVKTTIDEGTILYTFSYKVKTIETNNSYF